MSTSCTKNSKKKPMKLEQKEKAPKTLTTVMDGIDEILVFIDNIEEVAILTESEFEIEESKKGKKDSKPKEENKPEDSKQQATKQKEEENKTMTKDENIFTLWKDIDKKIAEIHKNWNSYEVESINKGANLEKANILKRNLNLFTTSIENRNIRDIIDTGSKTFNSLAFFFDLYKDETSGDLSKIKYSIYQAYLKAEISDINEAKKLLDLTEEYSVRIRQRLGKDKEKIKLLDKLLLSISDMKLALDNNSIKLLKIKRDIVLKNIKSLEK